jgi:hypothetical protein
MGAGEEMLEVAAFPREGLPELAFSSHRQAMSDWLRIWEQLPTEKT